MLDVVQLLFGWLPFPLDALAFGAVCLVVLVAFIRFVAFIWELLPFN